MRIFKKKLKLFKNISKDVNKNLKLILKISKKMIILKSKFLYIYYCSVYLKIYFKIKEDNYSID